MSFLTGFIIILCGWNYYGKDLQNTRCTDYSFNCDNLKVIWEFTPEKHVFRYSPYTNLWSTPVTVNLEGSTFIYIGFYDHNLYCVDLDTGKEVWRFTTGGKIISSPVVFRNQDKYMVSFASRDRKIYCLNAMTGEKLWNYEVYPWKFTVNEAIPSSGIFIPQSGKIYFAIYINDKKPFKTVEEGVVIALTPQGEAVWKKKIENAAILSSPCYGYLDGIQYLFISSANGNIYALSAENGNILWQVRLADKTYATPSVLQLEDRMVIYVGDKYGFVYALNERGQVLWKFKTGHFIDTSVAVLNEGVPRVYVTSFDRKIYCLNAFTGEKIFEFKTENYLYSSPLIGKLNGKSAVFFSALDNTIFILDAHNGELIQKIKLGKRLLPYETYGETMWPSAIITRHKGESYLLYPSTEGSLFCLGCGR